MNIGEQILLARRRLKATQEDVARKAGVHRNTIIAIEKGEMNIMFDTILAVVQAVGLKIILEPMDDKGGEG